MNWLEESCRLFFFIYNFFFLSCLLLLYLACTLPVLQVYRAQRLRTPGRCENGRASVETAVTWSESSEPPAREKDKREYCGEKNLIKNWREKNRFEKSIGKWKLPKQGFYYGHSVRIEDSSCWRQQEHWAWGAKESIGCSSGQGEAQDSWGLLLTAGCLMGLSSTIFSALDFFFLRFFCSVFCSQDLWPVVNTLLRRACTSTLKILLYCCLKATVAAAGCKFIDFLDRAFLSFAPLSKHHGLKSSTNISRKDVYSLFDSFGNLHFTSSI